jgi:hypothetical protein
VVEELDAAVGPIKQRDGGSGAGELLTGLAVAQLAGRTSWWGWTGSAPTRQASRSPGSGPGVHDRSGPGPADRAGEVAGGGDRPGGGDRADVVAAARGAALALAGGLVTIDLDTTDVEVYGSEKRRVAYNRRGRESAGRTWRPAEVETVLAADLGDGTDDPRATAPDLLRRALAFLPWRARESGRVAMRADAGTSPGQPARAAHDKHIAFAIGAKRIAPLWRLLAGLAEDDWHEAIEMDNAQVTVAQYGPDWWPANTWLLIRRVLLDPEQVSSDPRSRRRRTLHPDQRALPIPELAAAGAVYAYSFILTNLDVSRPDKAAAVVHRYRHRTTVEEHLPRRQARRRAAAPPSGYPQVNMA